MTAIIEPLTAETIEREGGELLHAHYDEVALNKDVMVLRPRWDAYQRMQAAGQCFILGARIDGKLVGYTSNFLTPHMHYASLIVCQNDAVFVAQEHRRTSLGLRLIKDTEAEAKARGARLMLWHAKEGTRLDSVLSRMGYGVQDIIYSRRL